MEYFQLGDVVEYTLSTGDVVDIMARRTSFANHVALPISTLGNEPKLGDVVPAMIVRVWPSDMVNLKVFLDGGDHHWAQSVKRGGGPGTYR